jgi:hypothetical protein
MAPNKSMLACRGRLLVMGIGAVPGQAEGQVLRKRNWGLGARA